MVPLKSWNWEAKGETEHQIKRGKQAYIHCSVYGAIPYARKPHHLYHDNLQLIYETIYKLYLKVSKFTLLTF